MDAPTTLPESTLSEKPRVEDLRMFLVLALPIFAITVCVVTIVLFLSPR